MTLSVRTTVRGLTIDSHEVEEQRANYLDLSSLCRQKGLGLGDLVSPGTLRNYERLPNGDQRSDY
jgi:hypothetical protein